MSERFDINISQESFKKRDGRFGNISVRIGDYNFPSENWTDFGTDIIYWWMEAITNLITETDRTVQCKFMDGNYRFDVQSTNDKKIWKVSFIKEYADSEETKTESEVDPEQMIEVLVRVAKRFEELERERGDEKSASNYNKRITHLIDSMKQNLLNYEY